ncbi:MAG TPA: alginate export family protein [Bryobacteraceae bacterium]
MQKISAATFFFFTALTGPNGRAECIVNNPGGSKINPNRPSDSDTPEASFSAMSAVNRRMPEWLCFTLGYRTRYEGYSGANFELHSSDSYLLTRFRLGMMVSPVSWLKVYGELQDADAFGKTPPLAPPYQETWDLRRAYVDIGNMQEGRFGLRAGRQDLNFEDGRLLGTSYWRNASKGYDAVEAVTNWSQVSATAFAASPVLAADNGLTHSQAGNDLYGLDGKFKTALPAGLVEPFLFWRLTPNQKTEEGASGKLDEKIVGLRLAGTIHKSWDYDTEGAVETGQVGANKIRAHGWLGIAGYTFDRLRYRVRIFTEYDYASGDRNPHDGVRGTFDALYPNVHDHLGLADQFAWQNLRSFRAGARVWLRRNWTVAGAWGDYWLADPRDGFYNPLGPVIARDPTGRSGSHLGEEYDAQTSYRLNRDIELGVGVGRILPGEFLLRTNHPAAYTYPYLMLSYNIF